MFASRLVGTSLAGDALVFTDWSYGSSLADVTDATFVSVAFFLLDRERPIHLEVSRRGYRAHHHYRLCADADGFFSWVSLDSPQLQSIVL